MPPKSQSTSNTPDNSPEVSGVANADSPQAAPADAQVSTNPAAETPEGEKVSTEKTDESAQGESDVATLAVISAFVDEFVYHRPTEGDEPDERVVITREGTEVPRAEVQDVINNALAQRVLLIEKG